jgi:hypothetical protein
MQIKVLIKFRIIKSSINKQNRTMSLLYLDLIIISFQNKINNKSKILLKITIKKMVCTIKDKNKENLFHFFQE